MTSAPRKRSNADPTGRPTEANLAELWRCWCAGDRSVDQSLLAHAAELPAGHLLQLVIFQQQQQWQEGHRVRAETLFRRYPQLARNRDCAIDLVYAEFLLESAADGSPSVSEYLDRFPDLREELERQFMVERGLGDGDLEAELETTETQGRVAGQETDPAAGEPSVEHDHPRIFGDYELLEVIATGGMGVVYKARQRSLNRVVALKMIRAGRLGDAASVERFYTEAKAAANLQHPHIVAVHEVGEHAGNHYFSMDFVPGTTLAEMVREHALLPRQAARYVRTIAETMQFAHEHGVLHRDLKPANVLVNELNEPLITDFGLAKQLADQSHLTVDGLVMGTPSYMPPEQAAGRIGEVEPRSDVYSLGATLYELLCARPPFRAANAYDTIKQVCEVQPVSPRLLNPGVPRDLDTICSKCLQKDITRRYQSAGELAADLGRFLADQPITARPTSGPERLWRWCHRNPRLATALGLAMIGFLAAVLSLTWGYLSTKSALATAERRLDQTRTAIDELFTLVADETLLNQPGLQPLRRDLLLKARDLYRDVLAVEGDHPGLRHDYSVSYFRLGRINEELGSPEEALRPLHRARSMQEQLLSDRPEDVQLQCDLSDTWNALGTVLSSLRRYREARPYFAQALDARQALVAGEPESREYQRKLANILMNMGVVSSETGDLPAARNQMQAAQSLRERLLVGEPDSEDVRRDLAKGYFNLGRIGLTWRASAAASEDTDAFLEYDRMSRDCLDRAIEQFERLPADSPWALSDQYLLATGYHLRGRATWEPERATEAHSLYEQALTRMQALVDANPEVHKYRGALARIHLDHGLLHAGQDEQEASAMLDAAREILKPLVEDYPDETDYRAVLATVLLELGKLRCRCDRLDAATSVLCQSAEHSRQLLDRLPDRPEYQQMHRQTLVLVAEVAEIYLDRGTLEKAGGCLQRGLHFDPDNSRFLQLQQRLQTGLAGAREE